MTDAELITDIGKEKVRLRECALAHACTMHPSYISKDDTSPAKIVEAAGAFYAFLTDTAVADGGSGE